MALVIRKHSMRTGMAATGWSAAINEVDMRKLADMSSTQGPLGPLRGMVHLTEAVLKLSAAGTDQTDLATLYPTDSLMGNGIAAAIPII